MARNAAPWRRLGELGSVPSNGYGARSTSCRALLKRHSRGVRNDGSKSRMIKLPSSATATAVGLKNRWVPTLFMYPSGAPSGVNQTIRSCMVSATQTRPSGPMATSVGCKSEPASLPGPLMVRTWLPSASKTWTSLAPRSAT